MKLFKRICNLIIVAMLVLFPFISSDAANKISVPISVEWNYEGQKWANSPHKANLIIKPQGNAPAPSKDSFDYAGDYKVLFESPDFKSAGKYEYLIYQNNEDFEENGRTVTYDKSKYKLIFYVQNTNEGLSTTAWAYDISKYDENNQNESKEEKITFVNDDPHIHKNNGDIVDPDDPYHPYNPENPWYPDNPTDPTNPYLPVEPNKPTDPTNPDRTKDNTPIYTTEPEDPDKENEPINPTKPPIPDRSEDYWPEYPKPTPNPDKPAETDKPFPWWPWPWTPDDEDDTEGNVTPKPTDPSDKPNLPSDGNGESDNETPNTGGVDSGTGAKPGRIIKPSWWDKLIPDKPFDPDNPKVDITDPDNPTKPIDTSADLKPWWWDAIFPNTPYDPENLPKRYDEDNDGSANKGNDNDNLSGIDGEDNTGSDKTSETEEDSNADKTNSDQSESEIDDESDSSGASDREKLEESNTNNSIFAKDKNSRSNVKTGIESIAIWAIVLVIAILLYGLSYKERRKEK